MNERLRKMRAALAGSEWTGAVRILQIASFAVIAPLTIWILISRGPAAYFGDNGEASTPSAEIRDNTGTAIIGDHNTVVESSGLQWKYDYFWDALERADVPTVSHYAQKGMRLKREDLVRYVRNHFDAQVARVLIANGAYESGYACPVTPTYLDYFYRAAEKLEALEFVLKVCSNTRTKAGLDAYIVEETNRLQASRSYNAQLAATIESCRQRYESELEQPGSRLLNDSLGFNILGPSTYSERDLVLVMLQTAPAPPGMDAGAFIRSTISQACSRYHRDRPVDSAALGELRSIRELLFGDG